jgi:hypothetical protein
VGDRVISLAQDHVTRVNKRVFSERGRLFSVEGGQWCGRPRTQVYVGFSGWSD